MIRNARLILVPALAAVLIGACSSAGGASPSAAPVAAPTVAAPVAAPTEAPSTQPVPSAAMTDGQGDEVVSGSISGTTQTVFETSTAAGNHTEVRDGVVVAMHTANDPRATGHVKLAFAVDWYSKSGPFWATATITNDQGTWTGPCTGYTDANGSFGPFGCWMTGGGAYAGYTYYQLVRTEPVGPGPDATTQGIIYEGAPPAGAG